MNLLKNTTTITILLLLLAACSVNIEGINPILDDSTDTPEEAVPSNDNLIKSKIAAGMNSNSCAINSTGQLKCWGDNHDSDDNVGGLLGAGTTTNTTYNSPQDVDMAVDDYKLVSMGETFSCGISSNDKIKCWGDQRFLGDTSYGGGNTGTPRQIEDSGDFRQVAVGSYHACGIDSNSVLKCWGDSWGGKLARSGTANAVLESDSGVLYNSISSGRNHTCGITTENSLRCWGYNDHGQIGNGTSAASSNTPLYIDASVKYKMVSAAQNTSCAITDSNDLKCWGLNSSGQVGIGSTATPVSSPTLVDSGTKYIFVDVGYSHVCGVTITNNLKCWGSNGSGRLGNGSTTGPETSPVLIDASIQYTKVVTGLNHTCGVRVSGELFCWGENGSGALGDGTNSDRLSPVATGIVIESSF